MALSFTGLTVFNVPGSVTTSSSASITAGTLAAGTMAFLAVIYDNTGTGGAEPGCTVNDSTGSTNTWISRSFLLYNPGSAISSGFAIRIFTCSIIVEPNLVTANFGTACMFSALLGRVNTSILGNGIGYLSSGIGIGANTTTPSVTSSAIAINNLIVGFGGKKDVNNWVADSDTLNGSWTGISTGLSNGGTAATTMAVAAQSKLVTAAGAQTFNPTISATALVDVAWAQFTEFVPTRFYFSSTTLSDLVPATPAPSPAWSITTGYDVRKMSTSRDGSVMTSKTSAGSGTAAVSSVLMRQYVSSPLAAQTLMLGTTLTSALRGNISSVAQSSAGNAYIKCYILSGSTFTSIEGGSGTGNTAYTTTLTNRSNTNLYASSTIIILAGDRLICEVGWALTAGLTSRTATQSFGSDSATDLPIDVTTVTANNPWIEFGTSFIFPVIVIPIFPRFGLLGVG